MLTQHEAAIIVQLGKNGPSTMVPQSIFDVEAVRDLKSSQLIRKVDGLWELTAKGQRAYRYLVD